MNRVLPFPLISTLACCALLVTGALYAQSTDRISGKWDGAIEIPGSKLELSIAFSQKNGTWTGLLSIPVQQLSDMPLDDLEIAGDTVRFKLSQVPGNASFSGRFDNDFRELRGEFRQSGLTLNMYLIKEDAAVQLAEEARMQKALARFRVLADSFLTLRKVPGIAVGIVKEGKVILAEGFGYQDLDAKLPVTPGTLFAIGSSSKAFTAAGLAMLVDDGLLEWDKPVIHYMPDFRLMDEFATKEMTAVDLLTHQSGLPRHDLMWYGSSFSREEMFRRLRHLPPNKSFRAAWQYQNLMYMSAGVLTERLSGQSWEDFTRKRIFAPLGMNHSVFSHAAAPAGVPVALPYRKTEKDSVLRMPYRDIQSVGPAGSIYSNVEDMLKWIQFHLNGGKTGDTQLLPAAAVANLHMPRKIMENSTSPLNPEFSHRGYALGWFVYRNKDLDVVQHGGNIDGFSALVWLLPGENTGMVFLTNLNRNPLPGLLANYATDLLLDREYIDWYGRAFGLETEAPKKEAPKPVAGTKPSRPLKDFSGRYEHPGYGLIELGFDKEQLHFHYNDFRGVLKHWHYDVFQVRIEELEQDVLLTFHADKSGVIDRLGVPLEPAWDQDILFSKLPPELLKDAAYVESIIGRYDMDGMVAEMVIKNDKLFAVIPNQPEYELVPVKENWFNLKGLNGFSVEFVFEKGKSKAVQVKFHQPNGVFPAKRV